MADDTRHDGQPPHAAFQRVEVAAMEPAAISRARNLIAEHLRQWRCATPDDAALVVSELVTNAIVHAGGAARITVTREGDDVRIDVHDNGPGFPDLRTANTGPGGHGLHIVDQLSKQWGSRPTATGKLVWAVVPCTDQPPTERSARPQR
jgi:anti-sigma regulatory factor (Ser/Thr protein kinase)